MDCMASYCHLARNSADESIASCFAMSLWLWARFIPWRLTSFFLPSSAVSKSTCSFFTRFKQVSMSIGYAKRATYVTFSIWTSMSVGGEERREGGVKKWRVGEEVMWRSGREKKEEGGGWEMERVGGKIESTRFPSSFILASELVGCKYQMDQIWGGW